ncbi:hypothetical protein D6D00_01640 [Aureobasidium pullulans]|nr:hypothetical protein D6D00_01640 [Aureobasidium pullulans]
MANQSRLLSFYITILLSLLFLRGNAAPISFADVEESWKRGLSEQNVFEGMLDERTMAVRRQSATVAGFAKMIRDVLRRGEEVEVGVQVLRPVRNRRWEFNG